VVSGNSNTRLPQLPSPLPPHLASGGIHVIEAKVFVEQRLGASGQQQALPAGAVVQSHVVHGEARGAPPRAAHRDGQGAPPGVHDLHIACEWDGWLSGLLVRARQKAGSLVAAVAAEAPLA
jgi:hypothetical protein